VDNSWRRDRPARGQRLERTEDGGTNSASWGRSLADKLRVPPIHPLLAKQVAGTYSLSVLTADGFDPDTDEVLFLDGQRRKIADVATSLIRGSGFPADAPAGSSVSVGARHHGAVLAHGGSCSGCLPAERGCWRRGVRFSATKVSDSPMRVGYARVSTTDQSPEPQLG
jgi:hypothetical protein